MKSMLFHRLALSSDKELEMRFQLVVILIQSRLLQDLSQKHITEMLKNRTIGMGMA